MGPIMAFSAVRLRGGWAQPGLGPREGWVVLILPRCPDRNETPMNPAVAADGRKVRPRACVAQPDSGHFVCPEYVIPLREPEMARG